MRRSHSHLIADAIEALKDLDRLPPKGADLPGLFQLVEKLDYIFTPQLFNGEFWVSVARGMGMEIPAYDEEKGCGRGHILFYRLRGVYRRTSDFAQPHKRRRIPEEKLPERLAEARLFCGSIAKQ